MRIRAFRGGRLGRVHGWRINIVALTALTVCDTFLFAVGGAGAATTSTTTTGIAGSPVTTTTVTAGSPVTTTTVLGHVANQPNLDALTPHIEALGGPGVQYQFSSGASSAEPDAGVPSFLHSPGGPYLYDAKGRVVLLHGTNVVYKHAPYIAYPDPGRPWNFDASDAARMQSLGFNVVRLGIEWQGLEPGSGGPD